MLKINNLHASVEGKSILKGINLEVKAGEVHAIMGPNGSGKSTLASVIAGKEEYEVTEGTILLNNKDIDELAAEERAHQGVFLSFQYPVEIPGVSVTNFIKTAINANRKAKGLPDMPANQEPSWRSYPKSISRILGLRFPSAMTLAKTTKIDCLPRSNNPLKPLIVTVVLELEL